ncbi:MAG: thiamine diphosphokinase [Arcanobacterium sp.]|nr:thiamine diphosphokinase [Arcanobacterium sp.]MDY5588545.1 thiamine diphosphokinase [Arcanobacterium sp.]
MKDLCSSSSCLVVATRVEGIACLRGEVPQWHHDFVLCADGGQRVASDLGLRADAYIGDYDSSVRPAGRVYELSAARAVLTVSQEERAHIVQTALVRRQRAGSNPLGARLSGGAGAVWAAEPGSCAVEDLAPEKELSTRFSAKAGDQGAINSAEPAVFVLPAEKAMTDSEAAIDVAVQLGFTEIELLGGLGGRLDHTIGNLTVLAKYVDSPVHVRIFDGFNSVEMVGPGTHTVWRRGFTYFGVLAYGGAASGVTMRGVKYEVTDFYLGDSSTRGVSNEILDEKATISVEQGRLLLICSRD